MSLLLALAQASEVVAEVVRRVGFSGSKVRKVIVESVEDFVDEIKDNVAQVPKTKAKVRKAKKSRPDYVTNTVNNAIDWANYYRALADAIEDSRKAEEIRNAIDQNLSILLRLLERDKAIKEEESMLAILLTI